MNRALLCTQHHAHHHQIISSDSINVLLNITHSTPRNRATTATNMSDRWHTCVSTIQPNKNVRIIFSTAQMLAECDWHVYDAGLCWKRAATDARSFGFRRTGHDNLLWPQNSHPYNEPHWTQPHNLDVGQYIAVVLTYVISRTNVLLCVDQHFRTRHCVVLFVSGRLKPKHSVYAGQYISTPTNTSRINMCNMHAGLFIQHTQVGLFAVWNVIQ